MKLAQKIIEFYKLDPHPEGGWYKECYRSDEYISAKNLPNRFGGNRFFSTAIYFLLEQGNFSAFHRIKSDECWHFYSGKRLIIYIIHLNGELETIFLGQNYENGERFQFVVPANCWFASIPAPDTEFSFVGCTVSPGFDFNDFELANTSDLTNSFPQHSELIRSLCRQ
jgi:predicted cupin superfamily sugar epimerase